MPEPTGHTDARGAVLSQRCSLLRSKSMFIDVEPDPTVPGSESGVCWCLHTQNCLGPDGEVADEENCQPGRACYEAL